MSDPRWRANTIWDEASGKHMEMNVLVHVAQAGKDRFGLVFDGNGLVGGNDHA